MKNRSNVVRFCLFYFMIHVHAIQAQIIYVKVKKGSIEKNSTIVDYKTPMFKLGSKDVIFVPEGALVIAQNNKRVVEIPKRMKPYTFKEISSLKSSPKVAKKMPPSVFDVVLKNSMQHTVKAKGATTRGISRDPNFYAPADTFSFLSDTILLEFGNENTSLESNLKVTHMASEKVYYNEKPSDNQIVLYNLPSGIYSWEYSLLDNSNNKKTTTTYENIFVVLSNEEKIEFLNNLENFKSYLSHDTEYTEELKTILLKEFYESERIYLRE